nr:MAG TPA: hypothetical protein [Caudoviricetes sp.]
MEIAARDSVRKKEKLKTIILEKLAHCITM